MQRARFFIVLLAIALLAVLPGGCVPVPDLDAAPSPTEIPQADRPVDLSAEETRTLASLEMVDDYPLYVMHNYAPYDLDYSAPVIEGSPHESETGACPSTWACSLFAALGDASNMLYGRNFDWGHSPGLLLFNHPTDGYASVSMVDITYLGFEGLEAGRLLDLAIEERQGLLYAPLLPFDGMNDQGLTVGMAAVTAGNMAPDPEKETTGSLRVIRLMLDQAANVDEALDIMDSYNIDIAGGPPLHYLIADRTGLSVLVEFYRGDMVIIANYVSWNQATNFLRADAGGVEAGRCWRYDLIYQRLKEAAGRFTTQEAMDLLREVSQPGTQWSVVYGMSSGEVSISMGREYGVLHTFRLPLP